MSRPVSSQGSEPDVVQCNRILLPRLEISGRVTRPRNAYFRCGFTCTNGACYVGCHGGLCPRDGLRSLLSLDVIEGLLQAENCPRGTVYYRGL